MEMAAEDVPEAAVYPSTKDLIAWIGRIIGWVARHVGIALYHLSFYLSRALYTLVKLIYEPLSFILAPVLYLLQFLVACLQAPFKFLAKFETLYIYLAVGALIGITGGLLLNFIYGLLQRPLGLDTPSEQIGRTATQYWEDRQKEQAKAEPFVLSSSRETLSSDYFNLSDRSRKVGKGKGLLKQTIMEEADFDY